MATSGQIINILGKLGKGLKATEGEERTSKKKEEKQHKKMFSDLQAKFEKGKKKGEKPNKLANILSTAIALTGVGLPYALAANLALKTVAGHVGRKKSQDYLKGITGFEGTKFSGDLEQYQQDVAKDYLTSALKDTAMQALTAGTMKGISSGLSKGMPKFGEGIKKVTE